MTGWPSTSSQSFGDKSANGKCYKGSSPAAWENINLRGTYTFVKSDVLPDTEQLMSTIDKYLPDPEE